MLLSLHGTLRNGDEYFRDLCESIKSKLNNTLVVAPTFKREDDSRKEGELHWEAVGGIKSGSMGTIQEKQESVVLR